MWLSPQEAAQVQVHDLVVLEVQVDQPRHCGQDQLGLGEAVALEPVVAQVELGPGAELYGAPFRLQSSIREPSLILARFKVDTLEW